MLKLSQTPSFAEATKNHFKIGADFQTSEDAFSMTQTSDIKVKPAAYYSIIPTTICQDLEIRKSKLTKRRQATDLKARSKGTKVQIKMDPLESRSSKKLRKPISKAVNSLHKKLTKLKAQSKKKFQVV
jgi:hypothetical protein